MTHTNRRHWHEWPCAEMVRFFCRLAIAATGLARLIQYAALAADNAVTIEQSDCFDGMLPN